MPDHDQPIAGGENGGHRRFVFGEFEFDAESGELWHDGRVVQLEPQPAKVLQILVRHPGQVVRRAELRNQLWDDERHVEADQGLNYCIRELRRALGESARDPRYIETLRRRGYRFLQPVEHAGGSGSHGGNGGPGPGSTSSRPDPAGAADARPAPGGPGPSAPPGGRPVLRSAGLVLSVVLVLAAVAGGWFLVRPGSSQATGGTVHARIGVLPFDAPSGNEPDGALAAAVAGALVSELVRLGGAEIDVIPSTSSFAYRGTGKTVGEIGRELRADYLVEGSVRPGETGRNVDVRLVDTAEDSIVWTRTYGAGPAPDELAESVALDVTGSLGVGPGTSVTPTPPPGAAPPAASSAPGAGR